jgi:hypothetical protein
VKYGATRRLFILTHAAAFYMNVLYRFRVKACLGKDSKITAVANL